MTYKIDIKLYEQFRLEDLPFKATGSLVKERAGYEPTYHGINTVKYMPAGYHEMLMELTTEELDEVTDKITQTPGLKLIGVTRITNEATR